MEAISSENFAKEKIFLKDTITFEKELKEKLKWDKQKWKDSGEKNVRIQKLCNSLNFWKKKLKPAIEETSLILTMYNDIQDVKTELVDIVRAIESLDRKVIVQGFSNFRNPRYLCLYFENEEEKSYVEQNFKIYERNYVVFMSWALELTVDTLKVHWLPMTANLDNVKKALDKYVYILEEERIKFVMMNGRKMQSGQLVFKVKFKEGVKQESVPHVTVIEEMEALITVQGRAPLCLNCNALGHISRKCNLRYCEICKSLKRKEHKCVVKDKVLSYADVVRVDEERGDSDDWGGEIVSDFTQPLKFSQEKVLLAGRIAELEKQLNPENVVLPKNSKRKNRKRKSQGSPEVSAVMSATENEDSIQENSGAESVDSLSDESEGIKVDSVVMERSVLAKSFISGNQTSQKKDSSIGEMRTYSKSSRFKNKEAKAKKAQDKMWEVSEFVFED